MKIYTVILAAYAILITTIANAVTIGYFPGLEPLIEEADAIVILRVDQNLSDFNSPTLYSTHDCYIYQTLKGDIPPNTTVRFQLMDTRHASATPYSIRSTHLMFLTKKRGEYEPTDYRTLQIHGANITLPSSGHEVRPEGKAVADQIRTILVNAVSRNAASFQKEQDFLNMMMGETAEQRSEVISNWRNWNTEKEQKAEQGGPAYPPQGVGSADP